MNGQQDRSQHYMARINEGYAALKRGISNTPLTKALDRWGTYGPVIRVGEYDIPGAVESYLNGLREIIDAVDEEDRDAPFRFQRVGNCWHLGFTVGGVVERGVYSDQKGFRHLARLLAEEGREIVSLDLAGQPDLENLFGSEAFFAPAAQFDQRAASEMTARARALETGIQEARNAGHLDEAEKLFEEQQQIREYLLGKGEQALATMKWKLAQGLGPSTPRQRAHKAVARAMNRALRLVGKDMPTCARYLERSVESLGSSWVYRPFAPTPKWLL